MNDKLTYQELSNKKTEEILSLFKTSTDGLTKEKAQERLEEYGENIATNRKKKTAFFFLFEGIKDKFVLILILLAAIDFMTNDTLGACIILGITGISVLIRFTLDLHKPIIDSNAKLIRVKTEDTF